MTKRNASRLEAGLIARKGEAAPALRGKRFVPAGSGMSAAEERAAGTPRNGTSRGIRGTIAVTLRLDPGRYERMKVHGARQRLTNQDILVEALDRYFESLVE